MATVEKFVVRDGLADGRTMRQRLGDAWTAAKRSFTLGPWNPKDKTIAKYFGGGPVAAGVSVSEASVFGLAAVFSAVTTISFDIGGLPLKLFRRVDRGREPYVKHSLYTLLHDQANPEMTSFTFRQTMMQAVLLSGNAFAEIERDAAGRPRYLWPIMPSDRVSIVREGGRLRYRVHNGTGGDVTFDPSDILHFKGPSADGVCGLDVVQQLREMFGLTLASERFAATYFSNSTVIGGTITAPQILNDQTRMRMRESIEARHQGSDRAHGLMLLDGGATFQPLEANLRESQFTELRTHQIREVARAFRMPPSKLGDLADATFSNVEHENLRYLTQCLTPWLRMIESELTVKLISPLERNLQTIEFVVDGLLRADVEKRGTYYAQMVSHGLMTPNEVRRLENLPEVDGGDDLRVPANTTPLTRGGRHVA